MFSFHTGLTFTLAATYIKRSKETCTIRDTGTTGITIAEAEADPQAQLRRESEIKRAADTLDDEKMIRYDPASGMFVSVCARVCLSMCV